MIRLDDDGALDAAGVGDKAARLAHAARAGLPVAEGWIVPFAATESAMQQGRAALRSSGRAAATLAVAGSSWPGDTVGRVGWSRSIVRSSTTLDHDGRWAGAFASYLDVAHGDLGVAVRGCLASAFSRDVLARCEEMGVPVGGPSVAVLIQPWIAMDAGGTATVHRDGTVSVWGGTDASQVVSGAGSAARWHLTPEGHILAPAPGSGPAEAEEAAHAAAALALVVAERTGDRSIEWAWHRGTCTLLQCRDAMEHGRLDPVTPSTRPRSTFTASERARRRHLVDVATRFPGPLGDELVLPWAAAGVPVPTAATTPIDDPIAALDEIAERRDELARLAWAGSGYSVEDAIVSLLSGSARTLMWTPRPGAIHEQALMLMSRIDALAGWVAGRGIATDPRAVWRWTVEQLRQAIRGVPPAPTNRRGRWEPFAASVLLDDGAIATGRAVTEGVGAGRVHALGRPGSGSPGPRSILAVGTPLPQIAPLLWQCAALVSARGNEGAHLFEVASSLGVPSVVGVDLRTSHGEPAAVDGAGGLVATPAEVPAPAAVGRTG